MYQVLIVEDDPMVAMIHEQYLKKNKKFHVVGKCKDGKSALNFLETTKVDLLILDVFMPQMDGFETLSIVRERRIAVEVIMVTASDERESLEQALHLGVVDYLVKPFTFERFWTALGKFEAQRHALLEMNHLSQRKIDFIMEHVRKQSDEIYPKGIQEKTLKLILDCMKSMEESWVTGDEIAGKIGLTSVTVRRYLNYLAESGKVQSEINYDTGGRPCMKYKKVLY